MTTGQRVALGLGLVGAFVVSVVVGAFIARQLRGTSAQVVAVASVVPSNVPLAQPTSAPSALVVTPTPNPTPTLSATPTPTPGAIPTPAPLPTAAPTAAPTPAPSVALDPATAEEFVADLQAAINTGDSAYLAARLHPAVIERYGPKRCQRHLNQVPGDPSLTWEIQSTNGPAQWTWSSDGLDTVIDETWTVSVRQPDADPELRDLHFAPAEGLWRWFTDCGSPA